MPEVEVRESTAGDGSGRVTRWRDLCVAVSLANLVYLRVWAELLTIEGNRAYGASLAATPAHLLAVMVNTLLMGTLLWGVIQGLRSLRGPARKVLAPIVFLLLLAALLSSARGVGRNSLAVGAALGLLFLLVTMVAGDRSYRIPYVFLLVLSPFVLITFGQAITRLATYDPSGWADGPRAARLPPQPEGTPRVVWVVFDEWDYRLTFPDRLPGYELRELDRLKDESFFATEALTANVETYRSMPSLISGVFVDEIAPDGPAAVKIRLRDTTEWLDWSQQPNVFGAARAAGFNTAVAGWAVPYCRVLNASFSDCWWWPTANQYNSMGTTFSQALVGQTRSLFETKVRSFFGASLSTLHHARSYEQMLGRALKVAADKSYGLALVHLPVPHGPFFYNADTGRNDFRSGRYLKNLTREDNEGYPHALLLVDKTVGHLRAAMEDAGVWDLTTVIITSDHPLRSRPLLDGEPMSRAVPFLVKAPGSSDSLLYKHVFSSVMTKELILAILAGEVSDSGEIADWIDTHRSAYPIRSEAEYTELFH